MLDFYKYVTEDVVHFAIFVLVMVFGYISFVFVWTEIVNGIVRIVCSFRLPVENYLPATKTDKES